METKNKNKIIIGVIIALVIIIYIIVVLIVGGKNPSDNIKPKYLMINESLLWQKKNNKWVQLKEEPEGFYDNKFTVYHGNQKTNGVNVQRDNVTFYYFDEDYNELKYDNIKAISTNLKLKFADYEVVNANDYDQVYIDEVMEKIKAKDVGNYRTKKLSFDFDQDGTLENLYETTNFVLDVVDYDFYSVAFLVKDNKVVQIIDSNQYPYEFISVLDIDNDNVYELIMAYDIKNLATFNSCYRLYDYVSGSFKMIKNCS